MYEFGSIFYNFVYASAEGEVCFANENEQSVDKKHTKYRNKVKNVDKLCTKGKEFCRIYTF